MNVISKENIGLYRHDGLGIFKNMSGPEVERKKKDLMRIFKSTGLSITVKTNLKIPNFLKIHFEIKDNIYQPYKKLNDEPLYINKNFQPSSNGYKTDTQSYIKTGIRHFIK